jgi:kelch-like protein 10
MQDAETGKGRCMSMQAMQTLYDLRENNQLCDAIIVLDDGTEIPIHRALLCACSSYFRAAFTTLLHNKNETKVQIPGVSSEMMHLLLNYAYLRKLDLNKNNVFDVLITADYLSMLGALEMCCKYLENILNPKNCIGILLFARNHFCTELAQTCWRFIMKNFIQISQQSDEILMLSLKDFQEIINADNLNVKSEEIVWETILKWINHDPEQRKGHIVALMKCIRLGLLETQFFMEKVKDHPYVTSCDESRPMVIETLKFLYDLERIMHK